MPAGLLVRASRAYIIEELRDVGFDVVGGGTMDNVDDLIEVLLQILEPAISFRLLGRDYFG
jgi:hypothetical protein